jgi:hypothetical protein
MGAFETHLSYDFKLGWRVSLDGNFWVGGATSVNGVRKPGYQTGERGHWFGAYRKTPVPEIRLWQRHLHPVWRQLPEGVGGVAILMAGKTQLRCPDGEEVKCWTANKVGSKRETIAIH